MRLDQAGPIKPNSPPVSKGADNKPVGKDFRRLISAKLTQASNIKLSAHFQERLAQRAVQLSEPTKVRIARAMEQARAKGARQSLILVDDLAVIASVKNQTLVTIAPRNETSGRVFTNIDSAVIA